MCTFLFLIWGISGELKYLFLRPFHLDFPTVSLFSYIWVCVLTHPFFAILTKRTKEQQGMQMTEVSGWEAHFKHKAKHHNIVLQVLKECQHQIHGLLCHQLSLDTNDPSVYVRSKLEMSGKSDYFNRGVYVVILTFNIYQHRNQCILNSAIGLDTTCSSNPTDPFIEDHSKPCNSTR